MYLRKSYLQWMEKYYETPLIKVLVGMRRVGKSTLLQQFNQWLIDTKGVEEKQVLYIDKESLKYRYITDDITFYEAVENHFQNSTGQRVLFVDEIQEIENWEKVVNSLLKEGSYEIYITGSNAHMLSSDLGTYLAGRYVELTVYPLSYKEYIEINSQSEHSDTLFQNYITYGGFPGLTHLPQEDTLLFQTLDALYNSIILRDVIERYKIRNVPLLEKLTAYFFDNIGNLVTAKNIADYLKSQRLSVAVDSIQNYMRYLAACFAIYRVQRYDIKGKRYLEVNEKHYLGDIGLRHATLGYRPSDIGQLLENIVYLELRRRGYTIYIGKIGQLEVDFVAEKHQERIYVQVSYLLESDKTRQREFASLEKISDSFPKYVLTMDTIRQDQNGIRHVYLPDFLLKE